MILSYRNQSIDFQSKSIDWFLYESDIDLKRVRFLAQLLLRALMNYYICFRTWIYVSRGHYDNIHCVKCARIRSYSGPRFSRIFPHLDRIRRGSMSPCSVRMRENAGKMWTRITPNTDSFYSVIRASSINYLFATIKLWSKSVNVRNQAK